MTRTITLCFFLGSLTLTFIPSVSAQTQTTEPKKRFVIVNVGAQPERRNIGTSTSVPLYDEFLRVDSSQRVGGGVIVGIGGAVPLSDLVRWEWFRTDWFEDLWIAGEVTFFGSDGDGTLAASVPHPLFHDRPIFVNFSVPGLERKERAVHLSVTWSALFTDEIGWGVSFGPSFTHVSQQLLLTGPVPPFTQNISAEVFKQSGTVVGVNVGAEGTYMFNPRYAAALFARYISGSTSLPSISDVKVGGFQIGVGARVFLPAAWPW